MIPNKEDYETFSQFMDDIFIHGKYPHVLKDFEVSLERLLDSISTKTEQE